MSYIKPSLVSPRNYPTQNRRLIKRNRSKSLFWSRLDSVLVLRIIWILTILWAEWIYFDRLISSCSWPTNSHSNTQDSFKVLVIADPQLPSMDYSYPTRSLLLRWISIQIIDQFIRKSWRLVIQNTHPDAVVFLGDLLDGGIATMDPSKFQSYVKRFYHTFPTPNYLLPSKNQTRESPTHFIHLVGNHDVGLYPSTSSNSSTQARERFKLNWSPGQLNGQVEWANHTIIWLDALGLIEETNRRASGLISEGQGEVTQFVNRLTGPQMLLPKVLFTHVPLWRPEGSSCGPLRESRKDIHQGAGINYQNEISEEATKMLLEKIQPNLVFSGDDHDYCEVVHTLPSTSLANPSPLSIHEISVKSFSMGMGVEQPGYHLLTLSNSARFARAPDEQTTFHKPCLLPNQIWLYTHVYSPLFLISLFVLFGPAMCNLIKKSGSVNGKQAKTNGLPIHHRTHKKSLSRTLMFSKSSPGSPSSSSESSTENLRSDDESASKMFMTRQTRRSASVGLGIGLVGLEGGDSTSYHSPINSAHDDDRFSHSLSGTGIEKTQIRHSVDHVRAGELTNNYLPHYHQQGRGLSRRFQHSSSSSDRIIFKFIRFFLGYKMTEKMESWMIKKRILSSSANYPFKRPRNFSSKRGPIYLALINLFRVIWIIFFVYFFIFIWFDRLSGLN